VVNVYKMVRRFVYIYQFVSGTVVFTLVLQLFLVITEKWEWLSNRTLLKFCGLEDKVAT